MIAIISVIIAGVANALMDTIALKGGGILPKSKWWTMEDSWRNKWKNGDPKQGEAFLGSSTVFVFTTDAWHFFQMIMLTAFCIAAVTGFSTKLPVLIDLIILKMTFSMSFEAVWRVLNK